MAPGSLSRRVSLLLLVVFAVAPSVRAQAIPQDERRAFLTVQLHGTARLTANGRLTDQTGEVRRFKSPPLEPGQRYSYTFVAEWMPGNNYETWTVTRKVIVEAGKTIEVDLRKPDPRKGDTLFIRFVETPTQVVEAMMKLARVGKKDVVYDLGCGDGRIVITAVRDFGAKRGVGVDLDEKRLEESRANAREARVADKLEFRKGNVLHVKDLSEATVVMLYLSDDLNELLRPILQKQLRPGARIVSHRFRMGDWKPDRSETVTVTGGRYPGPYRIHLWTIKEKK